jgi:hypothetical protein
VRKPAVSGAAVALAAILLLPGCVAGEQDTVPGSSLAPGPLNRPNAHSWAFSQPVGAVFPDGLEILRLNGDREAVIESVELVGDGGLELVGVRLSPPGGRSIGSVQFMPGFPPRDHEIHQVVPAVGTTITPIGQDPQGWELLVGMRVTRDAYLVREAIRVTYTVDGKRYAQVLPAGLAVCASPRHEVDGECPPPRK